MPLGITYRRALRAVRAFETLGAAIFALGFWFFYGYIISDRLGFFSFSFSILLNPAFRFISILFWLGLVAWSFVLYRMMSIHHAPKPIQPLSRRGEKHDDPEIEVEVSWDEIARTPRRYFHDISESFTPSALAALERAYELALQKNSERLTRWHLLAALLDTPEVASIFARLGRGSAVLKTQIVAGFEMASVSRVPIVDHEAWQIFFLGYRSAKDHGQEAVHPTDLLVALVESSEPIQEWLFDLSIEMTAFDNVIAWTRMHQQLRDEWQRLKKAGAYRSRHGLDRAMTAVATPYLNAMSEDVTLAAKYMALPPSAGRETELEELFRVLEGGASGAIFVGTHGVGKKTLLEIVAQEMVKGDVPGSLEDKRLVLLHVAALVSGTTASGVEDRLRRILQEVRRAKNIVLAIPNVHDLIGVSDESAGGTGLDVAEALAEELSQGGITLIATATTEGFGRQIAHSALGARLTKIVVSELIEDAAIRALESRAPALEYRHGVFFSYAAILAAAELAKKFLTDQPLPGSALSLLTESATAVKQKKGKGHLVSADDVGAVVAQKTGVPVTAITEDESAKLLRLEEEMHKRIIGQDHAVESVANALRRARASMRSSKRPIAVFLFVGPTGVGKTELAKTIAEIYFGGEDRMTRLDMSEFQERGSVGRLIGESNAQGTGRLTEAIREHPFSLILLDELEKADRDVLNLFLQLFDDGRLTDSVGRVVDATNTIIIATSNAGTAEIQDQLAQGVSFDMVREGLSKKILTKHFSPEFLNRFDDLILFRSLDREEMRTIARLLLRRVEADLKERGVFLRIEEPALDFLVSVGYDPAFGARPMRRAIQDHIENRLAELILQGALHRRDTVILGVNGEVRVEGAQ